MAYLSELNSRYLKVHVSKEDAFWSSKMGLPDGSAHRLETTENDWKGFISNSTELQRVRAELKRTDLTPAEREGLEGWRRFFEVNVIESAEARELQSRITGMEARLGEARERMPLGYKDPDTGAFKEASVNELGILLATSPLEPMRRAAWEGLASIEGYVLDHGFLDVVRERNRLGRLLGYEDYYDYKVHLNEGFSKKDLFKVLDGLERDTAQACRDSIDGLKRERGASSDKPWNFRYATSGDVVGRMDPYFQFRSSVDRWARSFTALGVRYRGATLTLDLLDRKGKYGNGFMHGPFPAFVDGGKWLPARINFTSNAVLGKTGAGHSALATLFHEGGHAAHFSNIQKPAPCFSQEFAPTSVAFAETQSMFMDNLLGDPDWKALYAHSESGEPMAMDLVHEAVALKTRFLASRLRQMLSVVYAEKAIYELKDQDLTPSNVLKAIRDAEKHLTCLEASPRPVLAVPHLLAGEASAYYHGYVLAEMAVYQTRDHFLGKYGYLTDNPSIGPELAEHYWKPGNARNFLQLVKDLTGEEFSSRATGEEVGRDPATLKKKSEAAMAAAAKRGAFKGKVDLDAHLRIVHGEQVVAEMSPGDDFGALDRKFRAWIDSVQSN